MSNDELQTISLKENRLALLMRAKYGDNAVEALVGVLSSVIEPGQLDALLASLALSE